MTPYDRATADLRDEQRQIPKFHIFPSDAGWEVCDSDLNHLIQFDTQQSAESWAWLQRSNAMYGIEWFAAKSAEVS